MKNTKTKIIIAAALCTAIAATAVPILRTERRDNLAKGTVTEYLRVYERTLGMKYTPETWTHARTARGGDGKRTAVISHVYTVKAGGLEPKRMLMTFTLTEDLATVLKAEAVDTDMRPGEAFPADKGTQKRRPNNAGSHGKE